jgi:phenylalanyl-tRNA synthetase beta chain
MNASHRWLLDLAPELVNETPEALAERLTALGFPVESLQHLAGGAKGVVVARVISVRQHPNADRLRVCEVDSGSGLVQVVCGAPNVEAGGWYPLAPVGALLPGGLEIRKAKLRGELSEGMLCSESELGLGRGKEGLMTLQLDPDSPHARPGTPLIDALGLDDTRLEVEVTSNRPDLLSHRGIARELVAGGEEVLRTPGQEPLELAAFDAAPGSSEAEGGEGGVTLRIEAGDLCPRYLGVVVDGVEVAPSPSWVQDRLRAVGARPINNVVDATNLVLLEWGQPLHAFDLDRIRGGEIRVRRARQAERLRTLDGIDRPLAPEMLVIADAEGPMAVAGVMGGADSEVTEATQRVFLECALFTPGPIRATRKALGLSTDASYRFERGVDPEGLLKALQHCLSIILETAGGRVRSPALDVAVVRPTPVQIPLRLSRIERVLGLSFTEAQVRELLTPLGFKIGPLEETEASGAVLPVRVPGWRFWDVKREVDLVEEVARRHGYDNFPDTLSPWRAGTVPDHPLYALEERLRTLLEARGMLEGQTPAFAPEGEGEVEVLNPLSAEERWLRSTLLPGLLRRLSYNLARGNRDVRLYELGTVFHRAREAGDLPQEATRLALVLHGARAPHHFSGASGEVDLWELRGILEGVVIALNPAFQVVPAGDTLEPSSPLNPGATFRVVAADGSTVGWGGEVKASALDLPPWAGSVFALEVTLPESPQPSPTPRWAPLPTHPGVERDLALLVPEVLPVGEVLEVISAAGGSDFQEASIFDVYQGKGVPEGMRSVAVRLRFRGEGRSLTDGEVDEAVGKVISALHSKLQVGVRGG